MHAKPLDQYNSHETTRMHACMSQGDVVNVDGLTSYSYISYDNVCRTNFESY